MSSQTYTVGPMPGDSTRWRVLSDGYQVSKHNSKSNAIQRARELADRNDSITIQQANGQFGRRIR